MGDVSETESESSSLVGDQSSCSEMGMKPPSPASREQLSKRLETLLQENLRLKTELEGQRLRVRTLQQENKSLKQTSVLIQAKAEQEEEFISNTLLKKIQELKKEKEALALNYEQEEEFLTNDLSRKLNQLRNEKAELAQTLQQEQESLVNKLMRRIQKLESETNAKQSNLEQLRREKVELENTLEQEQEALVNRLWKRMDRLEAEKRSLQEKMEQPISAPPSPMDIGNDVGTSSSSASSFLANTTAGVLTTSVAVSVLRPRRASLDPNADSFQLLKHVQMLRDEVARLKQQLMSADTEHVEKTAQLAREEQQMREENLRLRRKLELEMERRQELCRHLSESESSLEMEDERHFNELSYVGAIPPPPVSAAVATAVVSGSGGNQQSGQTTPSHPDQIVAAVSRNRTISSPNPVLPGRVSPASFGNLNVNVNMSSSSGGILSQISPATTVGVVVAHIRCPHCGSYLPSTMFGGCAPSPSSIWNSNASVVSNVTPNTSTPSSATAGASASVYRTKSNDQQQQQQQQQQQPSRTVAAEKFVRPANPPTPKAASPAPASPKQQVPTTASMLSGVVVEPMEQYPLSSSSSSNSSSSSSKRC